MEKLFEKLVVFVAKIIVIGFFTFIYVTPLFWLFYIIIFKNLELLQEISLKSYLISYLIGFVFIYISIVERYENDEKLEE